MGWLPDILHQHYLSISFVLKSISPLVHGICTHYPTTRDHPGSLDFFREFRLKLHFQGHWRPLYQLTDATKILVSCRNNRTHELVSQGHDLLRNHTHGNYPRQDGELALSNTLGTKIHSSIKHKIMHVPKGNTIQKNNVFPVSRVLLALWLSINAKLLYSHKACRSEVSRVAETNLHFHVSPTIARCCPTPPGRMW